MCSPVISCIRWLMDDLINPPSWVEMLCFSDLSLCRGVGCIFYEMATGRPLFPGSTVEEELHFIFKLLGKNSQLQIPIYFVLVFDEYILCICIAGTPTEQSWPGISSNEDFVTNKYPRYKAETLGNHTPRYNSYSPQNPSEPHVTEVQ